MNSKEFLLDVFEGMLDVKFPKSYRQFLIERGTAKIAGYTILGIPEELEKPVEVEHKEVKAKKVEALKVETKKSSAVRQGISVVEAAQFLLRKRPELKDKKLVPVCFATDFFDKMQYSCNI